MVKYMLCFAAVFALAALPRVEAALDADPALIVVSPDAYVGKAVTVEVKFAKIDNGSEPWEEQANLKASSKIKFTAAPLAEIKCYASRTPRNMEVIEGLKKGKKLILTGAIRRYRMEVKTTHHQMVTATGRRRTVEREEKGRIRTRYAFIVESIVRAE